MDESESSDDDGVVCIYCLTRPLDDSNQRKWYQCPEGHLLCGTCREPVISCVTAVLKMYNLSQLLQGIISQQCPAMCGNILGNIRNRALEAMVERLQLRRRKQLSSATARAAEAKDVFRSIINSRSLEVVRITCNFFKPDGKCPCFCEAGSKADSSILVGPTFSVRRSAGQRFADRKQPRIFVATCC
jgi:hypothetical protein